MSAEIGDAASTLRKCREIYGLMSQVNLNSEGLSLGRYMDAIQCKPRTRLRLPAGREGVGGGDWAIESTPVNS